jgi:hypothetical protein
MCFGSLLSPRCSAAASHGWSPKRVRVPIAEAEVLAGGPAPVIQAGENAEIVAHGRVVQAAGQPIGHAVVTALRLSGAPLDWCRADNNGAFSLALPGLGLYLLIVNADGWTPRSEVVDFADASTHHRIQLNEPLMLTGRVLRRGLAVTGALVCSVPAPGSSWPLPRATRSRYRLRLPPPGHHILTVLEPDTLQAPIDQDLCDNPVGHERCGARPSSRPVTQLS